MKISIKDINGKTLFETEDSNLSSVSVDIDNNETVSLNDPFASMTFNNIKRVQVNKII